MAEESAVPAKRIIPIVTESVMWAISAAAPLCVGITTLVDAQTPTDHAWGGAGILLGVVLTIWGGAVIATDLIKLDTR